MPATVGSSHVSDAVASMIDLASDTRTVPHPVTTQARCVHVDLRLGSLECGALLMVDAASGGGVCVGTVIVSGLVGNEGFVGVARVQRVRIGERE